MIFQEDGDLVICSDSRIDNRREIIDLLGVNKNITDSSNFKGLFKMGS